MANWCQTKITINHEDENKLIDLYNKIEKWCETDYKQNGFGNYWLGNIVGNSGIGTVDENPNTDLRCRGMITYLEIIDNQLLIDTETAWQPMLQMWVKLIDKYLPDAELIYNAEECGCELYYTNDPCLIDGYIIDAWDIDNIYGMLDADETYLIKLLQDLLKTEECNIDKLIKMFEESEYVDKMSIHKWEYADVNEWEQEMCRKDIFNEAKESMAWDFIEILVDEFDEYDNLLTILLDEDCIIIHTQSEFKHNYTMIEITRFKEMQFDYFDSLINELVFYAVQEVIKEINMNVNIHIVP